MAVHDEEAAARLAFLNYGGPGPLTDDERTQLRTYLQRRWFWSASKGADHLTDAEVDAAVDEIARILGRST